MDDPFSDNQAKTIIRNTSFINHLRLTIDPTILKLSYINDLVFEDCFVEGNVDLQYVMIIYGCSDVVFSGNIFRNNTVGSGIQIRNFGDGYHGGLFYLQNNIFENNIDSWFLRIEGTQNYESSFFMDNNIIHGNYIDSRVLYLKEVTEFTILHNNITENRLGAAAIFFSLYLSTMSSLLPLNGNLRNDSVFKYNNVSFNSGPLVSKKMFHILSSTVHINYNIFQGNDLDIFFSIGEKKYILTPIDAKYNYWGCSDIDDCLTNKLESFFENGKLGMVFYTPFITDPDDFESVADDWGSKYVILGTEIWNNSATVHLYESVYIAPGGNLTIEPGSNIFMEGPYGVYAEGHLDARGTEDQKIVFDLGIETRNVEGCGLYIRNKTCLVDHVDFNGGVTQIDVLIPPMGDCLLEFSNIRIFNTTILSDVNSIDIYVLPLSGQTVRLTNFTCHDNVYNEGLRIWVNELIYPYLDEGLESLIMENFDIQRNLLEIIVQSVDVTFQNSKINGNERNGNIMIVFSSKLHMLNTEVKDNDITSGGQGMIQVYCALYDCLIQGCDFSGNEFNVQYGIYFVSGYDNRFDIRSSKFKNNNYYGSSQYSLLTTSGPNVFMYNEITGNTNFDWTMKLFDELGYYTRNIWANIGNDYELYPFSSDIYYFKYNYWWGETDIPTIEARILLPQRVDLEPILTTANVYECNHECNGVGTCVHDKYGLEACDCSDAILYTGKWCNMTWCAGYLTNDTDNVCNGHGDCLTPENCTCVSGYRGLVPNACNLTECVEHAHPDASGTRCVCDDGYFGEFCNVTECYGTLNNITDGNDFHQSCHYKGNCVNTNRCFCEVSGYYGDFCNISVCYGVLGNYSNVVCSGHGECSDTNECLCDSEYFSETCNITKCQNILSNVTEDVCSGHGTCVELDVCQCVSDFFGSVCDVVECYNFYSNDTDNVCSGNGECKEDGLCDCFPYFAGTRCHILLQESFEEFNKTINQIAGGFDTTTLENMIIEANKTQDRKMDELYSVLDTRITNEKSDLLNRIDAANETQNRRIDNEVLVLDGRITDEKTDLEGQISSLQTNLEGQLRSANETQDRKIDNAIIDIGSNAGDITTLNGQVSDLDQKIDDSNATQSEHIENEVNRLDGRINTAVTDIGTNTGGITTLNGQVTTLDEKIENANATQSEHIENEVNRLDGRIDSTVTDTGTNTGDITTLNGQVSDLDQKINEANATQSEHIENEANRLDGRIDSTVADIGTNTGGISTLNGQVVALDQKIDEANTTQSEHIENEVTRLDGRIDSTNTEVGINSGDITTLNGQVTTLDQKIDHANETQSLHIENEVTRLDSKIDAAIIDVGTNAGDISTNTGDITTLNGQVGDLDQKIDEANSTQTRHLENEVMLLDTRITEEKTDLESQIRVANETQNRRIDDVVLLLDARITNEKADLVGQIRVANETQNRRMDDEKTYLEGQISVLQTNLEGAIMIANETQNRRIDNEVLNHPLQHFDFFSQFFHSLFPFFPLLF